MHFLSVSLQLVFLSELFGTRIAAVWFAVDVDKLVVFQVRFLNAFIATLIALVRLGAQVNS